MNYSFLIFKLRTVRMSQTQGDFAKGINIAKATISGWENGHKIPSRESLEVIADYVKMPLPMMLLYGYEDFKLPLMINKFIKEQDITL